MVSEEYREMHPIKPFRDLVIRRPNGVIIRINALGTTRVNPAIDIHRSEQLPSGRTKNDFISFLSVEFPTLLKYLIDVEAYWQGDGGKQ